MIEKSGHGSAMFTPPPRLQGSALSKSMNWRTLHRKPSDYPQMNPAGATDDRQHIVGRPCKLATDADGRFE
jgi:hypothetical protein